MEISLIRHGKSKQIANNKMAYNEFNDWIGKYNDVGVFEEKFYPLD